MKENEMKTRSNAGFTLLEILLVVVIIGMLVGVAALKFGPRAAQAKVVGAKQQIAAFSTVLGVYQLENGFYPTTEQGLQALLVAPTTPPVPANWKEPYLDKLELPKDPWGRPYIYKCPGTKNPSGFDLYSTGPNGVEGDEDDIGNWQ
jgi:general secretion pathway protein G